MEFGLMRNTITLMPRVIGEYKHNSFKMSTFLRVLLYVTRQKQRENVFFCVCVCVFYKTLRRKVFTVIIKI